MPHRFAGAFDAAYEKGREAGKRQAEEALQPVREALEQDAKDLQAALMAVVDQAVELHDEPHPLMDYRDALLYRLGTTAQAYLELNTTQAIRQHDELMADLIDMGEALTALYLQAINGVVCDPTEEPGRRNCTSCRKAWEKGMAAVKKRDPKAGNMYRPGPIFQPGYVDPDASPRKDPEDG